MSFPYEETLEGLSMIRLPPSARHELVVQRLHQVLQASLHATHPAALLPVRATVKVRPGTTLRPDLALVMRANHRLWLAAEVIHAGDHQPDTVTKKSLYEDLRVPRLWMVDPRYDNVEVYHATPYGLRLQSILAGREVLTEKTLGGFACPLPALFADPA